MWRKIVWVLPSALGLLWMGNLNGSGGQAIATPSPVIIAQAQTAANFRVGQSVIVRYNNQYYTGTVTRVSQENGFTRVDYSWVAGNMSGSGYTFPAFYDDVLTIEEATRRGLAIANADESSPPVDSAPTEGQSTSGQTTPDPPQNTAPPSSTATSTEILAAHNRYRQELDLPLLVWSDALADDAQSWANQLASMGGRTLVHSSFEQRNGQGENLWMGTAGYYSYTDMVDGWGSEREFFRSGVFPNVSTTGNWSDVGHYTQIVWRNTTEVGCAKATAGGNDILVCRYNPAGNFQGQPVF